MTPTPTTSPDLPFRPASFDTLAEGFDYAAQGVTGLNFYSARGELTTSCTYRELRDQALVLARKLIRAGLPRDARFALLADTTPEFILFFLACQYAGLVPVPLPLPTSIGGRDTYIAGIRRQLQSCRARAVMCPDELDDYLQSAVDGLAIDLAGPAELFASLPDGEVKLRPFNGDEICYLQYSSGSTRRPQGVEIPQRALMANCQAITRHGLRMDKNDRCVSWLPLYHDMGLVGFMLVPVLAQRSIDYFATRDFARRPLQWLSLISRNRGTLSFSPSFGYDLCTRRSSDRVPDAIDLSCWRVAGIGGDMVQPAVLHRFSEIFKPIGFRDTALVPSYGLAEATLAVSFSALGAGVEQDRISRAQLIDQRRAVPASAASDDAREIVLCGPPLPGHQAEVRDAAGQVVPEREIGRILIKGPSIMAGYVDEPEATAHTLDSEGWLDTGDLGYCVDGKLAITGRDKDLIIVNGRNIWPQDLEWAIEELSQIRRGDAAAFSIADAATEDRVVLCVQCRLRDAAERAGLIREIKGVVRQTAGIECDVTLVAHRDLPKTSSGKLSRTRARQMYLDGSFTTADDSPPGPTVRTLEADPDARG